MLHAIYSKHNNVVRVHYSHLTEQQADNEIERLNGLCTANGAPAIYWHEPHHPDHIFVIA